MTDLFDRLFPGDSAVENIGVHVFHAAIVDYIAGHTTRNQIVGVWALDTEATTDLDVLLAAVDALDPEDPEDPVQVVMSLVSKLQFITEMDTVNKLAEDDLKYNTKSAYRTRLGL